MPDIECPSCGTVTTLAVVARTAEEFCPTPECDFPLFWAPSVLDNPGEKTTLDTSLRRLPGTAGRVAIATIDCPTCSEPNPFANILCLRCNGVLRPEPEPEIVYEPPPPPPVVYEPPPPPKRVIWPWIVIGLITIALLVWWAVVAWG